MNKFSFKNEKPRENPLGSHFKPSKGQSPKSNEEEYMKKISYASTIDSLMYVMVCTILDITNVGGIVSRFMSNLTDER